MIAVGICTAPRPTCYLQDTIDSLQAAGLYPSVICQDGGNYDNWVKMARKLLNRRAEFLMTCEDDITIREDACEWLVRYYHWQPQDGFLSLYTSGRYRRFLIKKPEGVYGIKDSLWGACCLLWHRDTLRRVVDAIVQDRPNNVDGSIGRTVDKLGLRKLFALPSLVEHEGEVSSLGDRPYNENRKAIRPDWKYAAI